MGLIGAVLLGLGHKGDVGYGNRDRMRAYV
jgi:hypothetical protein